ncbi:MAG: TIGR03087 family PEP-CTERM/XrtA system glycosyltransferase [Vicinamibacterales bacterium]
MRVLFLTHRLPYAPNRGDRIRAYHIVETLRRHVDLEVASLVHSADEMGHVAGMNRDGLIVSARRVSSTTNYLRAIPTLLGQRPLTHSLLHAGGFTALLEDVVRERPPDVVLAFCSGMARFAVEPPLAGYPLVIDLVDVDSQKWADLVPASSWPKRWVYAREKDCLARFEQLAASRAASTLVVNDREAQILSALAPGASVRVIPNGIDVGSFRPTTPPANVERVIFCGVMNYAPNVEGVQWFAREVWPQVRAARPHATFVIVGSDPIPAIRDLAASGTGIEVTGTVPSVQQYLWNAAVSVAPLQVARGIQNKVLEALAAGLPTVVTPAVAEGLPSTARAGCHVAENAESFARHTITLLALAPPARRAEANRADLRSLGWENQLAELPAILRNAVSKTGQ